MHSFFISPCEQNKIFTEVETWLRLTLLPEFDVRRPGEVVLLTHLTPADDGCLPCGNGGEERAVDWG